MEIFRLQLHSCAQFVYLYITTIDCGCLCRYRSLISWELRSHKWKHICSVYGNCPGSEWDQSLVKLYRCVTHQNHRRLHVTGSYCLMEITRLHLFRYLPRFLRARTNRIYSTISLREAHTVYHFSNCNIRNLVGFSD